MGDVHETEICCYLCNSNTIEMVYPDVAFHSEGKVYQCAICGLYQLFPQPSSEQLKHYYKKQYSACERNGIQSRLMAVMKRLYASMRAQSQYTYIVKLMDLPEGAQVVEFGSAEGHLLKRFADSGCRVLGVELDERRSLYAKSRFGLNVERTSVETTLEGLERGVDLFIFSHVIEHLPDPKSILNRCRQLLNRGGAVFIEVPASYLGRQGGEKWDEFSDILLDSEHMYNFSAANLQKLVEMCGLRAEGVAVFLSQKTAPVLRMVGLEAKVDHVLKRASNRFTMYGALAINTIYLTYLLIRGFETTQSKESTQPWAGTNEWMRLLAFREEEI